jgi:hypothetical protein
VIVAELPIAIAYTARSKGIAIAAPFVAVVWEVRIVSSQHWKISLADLIMYFLPSDLETDKGAAALVNQPRLP